MAKPEARRRHRNPIVFRILADCDCFVVYGAVVPLCTTCLGHYAAKCAPPLLATVGLLQPYVGYAQGIPPGDEETVRSNFSLVPSWCRCEGELFGYRIVTDSLGVFVAAEQLAPIVARRIHTVKTCF